jgi:ubiquinone/menaquinone biosynthesis C-methylase UbiE
MPRPAFIARQAGRPSGWFGRLLLRVMARETSGFNREVLDVVAVADGEHALEIGFGHGATLRDAATRAPGARLSGFDVAVDAERVAARRCRALVDAGRVELRSGDAATLPWGEGTFDAVYSVHTIYFWADPAAQLAEVRRVLRRGGRFVLGMRERSDAVLSRFPASVYRFYSPDEVVEMLRSTGFHSPEVRTAASGGDLRILIALAGVGS